MMLHPPSNRLFFTNPHNAHGRSNGTLMCSERNGAPGSWESRAVLNPGGFGYSCLSLLPVVGAAEGVGGVNATHVAVLYEDGNIVLQRPSVH